MSRGDGRIRAIRIVMVALLACCIAVPLALFTRGSDIMSYHDNRKLAEMPSVEEDGFTTAFESYMSDRIGLRGEMISGYQLANDKLFGLMTHPLYEYGDDGYVYFRFEDVGYDMEYLEAFADFILKVQTYSEARGVPFLYLISPSKAYIYPEHIPDTVPPQTETTDALIPLFEERGINYLDLSVPVREAKEAGVQVFNPVYDAGHWNSEGMYAASQAIIARLGEMGFDVAPVDLSEYHREDFERTTLPASQYPIHEHTYGYWINEEYSATDLEAYRDAIHMDSRFGTFWYWENERWPDAPELLMFQGSYFNTQGTMLYNQFPHAALVHDYMNILRLPYYFEVFSPDVLIFETAAYTVSSAYYPYDEIAAKEFPSTWESWADVPVVDMGKLHKDLPYDPDVAISDFWIEWEGEPICAAYVRIGDEVYDTILEDWDVVYFAVKTDALLDTHGTFYAVAEDGSTVWSYDFDIVVEQAQEQGE